MKKEVLITTPIYYVNDKPHIGHIYTSLLADCFSRSLVILDKALKIRSVSGVDEHGQKIQRVSELQNKKPIDICNYNCNFFKNILVDFNLCCSYQNFSISSFNQFTKIKKYQRESPDKLFNFGKNFIRTTDGRNADGTLDIENIDSNSHVYFIKQIWNRFCENDWIYLGKYSGFYSIKDETFFKEEELIDGKAPTGADVYYKEEDCYFFRISKAKKIVKQFLLKAKEDKKTILPIEKVNEMLSLIETHFEDLPVSRIKAKDNSDKKNDIHWGIDVPGDMGHIIYVWLDALFNYMSVLRVKNLTDAIKKWKTLSKFQFIGKEIVKFHTIYWPIFLIALETNVKDIDSQEISNFDDILFDCMFVHGWWTNEGKKISKSDGNAVDPYSEIDWIISTNEMIEENLAVDYFRFFLISSFSTYKDADYSRTILAEFINSNLIRNVGNLTQRTISMINQIKVNSKLDLINFKAALDKAILKEVSNINGLINKQYLEERIFDFDFVSISKMVFKIGNTLNKFINDKKPWENIKNSQYTKALNDLLTVIHCLAELAKLISPISPTICDLILSNIGLKYIDIFNEKIEIDIKKIKKNPKILPQIKIPKIKI